MKRRAFFGGLGAAVGGLFGGGRTEASVTAAPPRRRFDFWGENAAAYNSRDEELLLWGSAGTGKSLVLLSKCLTLLDKYPGCRGLLLRGTRASLTQSALVTWEEEVLGAGHHVLLSNPIKRRVRQSYEFPNRSEFVVAGLDNPGKTLSTQYDFVYIMEATEEGVTLDAFETLKRPLRNGRMRKDGAVWKQIMMDCNPTSPFHWIHQRGQSGLLRMFHSRHQDNPRFWDRAANDWTAEGRSYVEGTLKAMTGIRRKRFYEGVWSAAEGLVYDGFVGKPWDDPAEPGHLLPAGWLPPRDWPRVWGIDWGESAPTALVMCAAEAFRAAGEPAARAHFYREKYRTRLRPDELGRWAAREIVSGREPTPRAIVGDHDPVMVAEFERGAREEGHSLHVQQADKRDKKEGITAVQARFDRRPEDDGKPRIFFRPDALDEPDPAIDTGPNCLIAELVSYKYDANSIMDQPDPKAADHALDAARYVCRWLDSHAGDLAGDNPYAAAWDAAPDARQAAVFRR